ncbi:MAG: aromatic ring-hydroxylating dioxygenase subunit alpha [Alphaproteobacteria bacterium]|jgi:phenylpropionate dioxygenase-like ring-hydroxylating dioxygenase large terminal subunit|nr:aromatic ring-hydroxylating dioxygenase subunit alpha [Alphaproteobacteria bacterium]
MTNLRNVMSPIETANGLPNECYVDDEAYRHEQDTLFRDGWAAIGFGKDIAEPGMARPVTFLGIPMLMIRNTGGEVNVFQNVCRHRGMILIEEPVRLRGPITCPYHAWAYDLDGNLRRTPHVGGPDVDTHDSVKTCDLPLIRVRSHVWRDVIFVNVGGAAPAFEEMAAALINRWKEFDQPLVHTGTDSSITFTLQCNWKLAVENYCEAYHLPFVHPALNSYSRLEDHYNILDDGGFAGQGTTVYQPQISADGRRFPSFTGLSSQWDAGAEYIALFPNVLLGVHKDHAFAILLLPDGPGRTREQVEIYYADEAVRGDAFAEMRATNTEMWQTVFAEDVGVVEGMQRGRHATGYDGGKFSAVMDAPTHHFHSWVAGALSR